jgi:glycine betaine/proline transport system permease protein
VPSSIVEAAYAFGSSDWQVLWKVQFPLAIRSIRLGVNQTLMMALAMVTYASMIAVEGLGLLVLRGIGRLDVGLAALGGIGIVMLAIILDRLSQALAVAPRERRMLWRTSPLGIIAKIFSAEKRKQRIRV